MKNLQVKNPFISLLPVALGFLVMVGLPIQLASANDQAQSGPADQLLARLQAAPYDVSSVEIEDQDVRVVYRQSALQDQNSLPYIWLDMMMIVADELPEVEQVILEVSYLQEPFFKLSASGDDIRAVMSDQLELADFMAALQFRENRTMEAVLSAAFIENGYPFAGFEQEGTTLQIPLLVNYPHPYRDLPAAIDIASQAAVHEPELEIIEIDYWRSSGDQILLRAETVDLVAYYQGELPLLAMMAELEVTGETSVTRSPVLGRTLGLLNLIMAGTAAAFYGAIALRLRSWSLALKAGAFVVLPALIVGAVMVILML